MLQGQLRARLLEHLRHHNGDSMKVKRKQGKPSLTARLLSSLFLDYLQYNEFTFTISVFMPESQMASWRPFAYEEMLELLHLDPSSDMHIRLKLVMTTLSLFNACEVSRRTLSVLVEMISVHG